MIITMMKALWSSGKEISIVFNIINDFIISIKFNTASLISLQSIVCFPIKVCTPFFKLFWSRDRMNLLKYFTGFYSKYILLGFRQAWQVYLNILAVAPSQQRIHALTIIT